jgi:hypothetical protein
MNKVWLVSFGDQDNGWLPIMVCSSEDKALQFSVEYIQERIDYNKKLQLIFASYQKTTDRDFIAYFNEHSNRIVVLEETELDSRLDK